MAKLLGVSPRLCFIRSDMICLVNFHVLSKRSCFDHKLVINELNYDHSSRLS